MEVLSTFDEIRDKNINRIILENGRVYGNTWDSDTKYEISVPFVDLYINSYVKKNASYYIPLSVEEEALTEDFFRNNAKKLIDEFGYIYYKFSESRAIYDYCFENKLFKYLFQSSTFESWLLDYLVEHDGKSEELENELIDCLDDIIDNWDKNSRERYYYSFLTASRCFLNERFDLIPNFSDGALSRFSSEFLEQYFDDLYKVYTYIPSYLTDNKAYFDFILAKERIDLLSQFIPEFITDEIYNKYEVEFQKAALDAYYIPDGLEYNEKLRKYFFENKHFEKILDMKIPPLISYFDDDEFYEYFMDSYKIGVSENDPEILEYFLEQGEYRFVCSKFDRSLFNIEIFDKYPEIFTNEDSRYYKLQFSLDFNVLEHYLKKEDIFLTPIEFFSNDAIDVAIQKYPTKMLALILEKPSIFSSNMAALILALDNNKLDVVNSFSPDLFDEELLNTYGDVILDYFESADFLPFSFRITSIFKYCITHKRYKLLGEFDNDFYTDEIVEEYGNELLIGFCDKFPLMLKNDKLFEMSIELGLYNLAVSYNKISNEYVDKYFDELLKGLSGPNAYILKANDYFVQKCIDEDIPQLFEVLNYNRVTDEIIKTHSDKVIELLNSGIEKLGLHSSSTTFRFLVDNEMYNLLDKLSWRASDEEYIENHLDIMDKISTLNMPSLLARSTVYLKHCIDIGRKEYVMDFFYDNYDDLDREYIAKLIPLLSSPLTGCITMSFNVVDYLLEKNDFTYIDDFNVYCFGDIDKFSSVHLFFSDDSEDKKYDKYDLLYKYLKPLYNYSLKNGLPKPLKKNAKFFSILLKNEKYKLLDQFDTSALPYIFNSSDENYKQIVKYIEEYNNGIVPFNFVTNESLRKVLFEDRKEELFLQFILNVKSEEMLKRYAKKLGFEYEEFKQKIDYLLTRNDEIFNTVLPKMFESRMSVIDFRHLEKIMLYPELQFKLIHMTDEQLRVMGKVFDTLDSDSYDYTGVIVSIIDNLGKYKDLIQDIDFTKLSKEEINRLLIVLSRKDNLYGIDSVEDLNNKNYKNKKKKYFSVVLSKIKNGTISLEELKIALLEKKFGLSIEQVKFLVERYCHSLESLEKGKFDSKKYLILKEIDKIYKCEDLILLKYLYIRSNIVDIDLQTSVSLESSIRQEFAKLYSDSLYKIKNEHRVEHDDKLQKENKDVYDLLSNLTYKDKKIPVYIMDGDFRLQIHALGAYRDWERPENFKQDWERPKIAYHGICTSYIANNQIANARAFHPILGFDNYSSNSLLCAGNYDLFSDYAIGRYDSSMYLPYHFFLPDEMINNTRHTHNEMVIERRGNYKGATYKRLPNYVVMLVDDINNLNNYSSELWDEYCQAAHDYDIPLVIVDRLKYARNERNKIAQLEEAFRTTYDEKALEKIILEFSNNMIGCACYDENNVCEYNRIFSLESFSEVVNELVNTILKVQNERLRLKLIKMLYVNLLREKNKGGSIPSIDGITKILENAGVSLEIVEEHMVSTFDNERIINEYYYNASEEVQTLIEEDLNNNVDLSIIVNNINFGIYERRFKL